MKFKAQKRRELHNQAVEMERNRAQPWIALTSGTPLSADPKTREDEINDLAHQETK